MTLSTGDIIVSSCRSIGVALTMISAGVFICRYGLMTAICKKQLAKISMTVTIPALLFTNILDCSQDWSTSPCSNVSTYIGQGWPLLLLPAVNVGIGMLLGYLVCLIAQPPDNFRKALMAAVAFGNSTGLPITLIAVIRAGFTPDSEIGKVNPNLFLGIYLIFYPVLQWGAGTLLMGAPVKPPDPNGNSLASKLLADQDKHLADSGEFQDKHLADNVEFQDGNHQTAVMLEETSNGAAEVRCPLLREVLGVMTQPPVLASLSGFAIALTSGTSFDVRSIFVDTGDRDDDAPLEWFFNGILHIGAAAVPINMAILGFNIGSFDWQKLKSAPWKLNLMVVFAKMVLMPCVGICETLILRQFVSMDDGVDASFYLVVMIVTATPTANSIAVMAEFGGQDKDALATCIFTQYLFAPVLLAGSITVFVNMVQTY